MCTARTRTGRRLALLSLAVFLIGSPSVAAADEPAAPWPEDIWNAPLWSAAPPAEAASVPDPVLFLPPIALDGAATAAPPAGRSGAAPSAVVPHVTVGVAGSEPRPPAVSFPEGVLGGPQMTLNPESGTRVTIIPELGTTPSFGTTLRGAGISVQGGSSRLGVGVGLSRDEAGRTTGGLGVTLTFP